jgi:hypothetical protein
MTRRSLIVVSTASLVAGLISWATVPAASADAVCPSLPSVTAFAQVSGTVTSGGSALPGAAVYVVNMETGASACVITNASGAYSAPLPAVTGSGAARKPSDSWYIIANPDASSSLASAWIDLPASQVSGNVSGQNLSLAASNLNARALLKGSQSPIAGPAIVCLIPDRQLDPPVTCGVTQAFGGNFRAQLRVPSTGRYWIQGSYLQPSGWVEGFKDNPIIKAGSPTSVDVELTQQGSEPCKSGQVAVTGLVSRTTGGTTFPARAVLSVAAQWVDSVYGLTGWGLGWADSARDGTYQLCVDPSELPPNKSLSTVNLFLRAEPYAGGASMVTPLLNCATGCTSNVSLSWSPVIGGKIFLPPSTPANRARYSISTVFMTPDGPQPGPEILSGSTDASGNWGIGAPTAGSLPSGTYMLRAYPPLNTVGFAGDDSIFTLPGANFDLTLPQGNLTVGVARPDGDPSAWTWIEARKCVPRQGCEFQSGETDVDGKSTFVLSNGTWKLTAYPDWDARDLVAVSADVVVSGGVVQSWNGGAVPSTPTLTLRTPNAKLKVVRSDGAIVPQANINATPWSGNQGDDGPWDWQSSTWASTDDSGLAGLLLNGGGTVYEVQVSPPQSVAVPNLTQYIEVTGSGANIAISRCVPPDDWRQKPCETGPKTPLVPEAGTGAWILAFADPNVTGLVKDPDNVIQPYAGIQISRLTTDSGGNSYFQQLPGQTGWANSSESGAYALALPSEGRYRLTVRKPWNNAGNWAPRDYYLDVDSSLNVCERTDRSVACTPTGKLTGSAALTLLLARPNVTGTVRQVNGQLLDGGWMGVFRETQCPGGGTGCRDYVTGTEISQTGEFTLNLESTDDSYYLTVNPWQVDDTSVETTFQLKVQPSQTYSLNYTLNGSNVTGVIKTSDDSPAADSWVSVEKRLGPNQWNWAGGTNTNQQGSFGLYLTPGQYRFRVEPGPNVRGKGVSTMYPAGDDTYITVSTTGNAPLSILLRPPNLSGNVLLPGGNGAAVGSWLEVQKWNPAFERYEWTSEVVGTSTGADGAYALNIPAGRWQIVANPPWGNTEASRKELRVVATSATSVCLDNGSGGCDGSALAAGEADIELRSPNVVGSVQAPSGDPVGNTWVDVRLWNESRSSYEWSPDLNGLNVNFDGVFTANLPNGRYELTANPPWGSADYSRGSTEIAIASGQVSSIDGSSCGPNCPEIVIELGSPNVSGKVRYPSDDTAVAFAPVFAEKWNGTNNYWEWNNTYTNSTQSGDYALNLTSPGTYRITARTTQQTEQFADGRRYVVVDSTRDMCLVDGEDAAISTTDCPGSIPPGTDDSLPNTSVRLALPNLIGSVASGGVPIANSWVSIMAKTAFGYDWVGGTETTASGRFSFNVPIKGGSTTEYMVEVSPPWGNSQGLTRKRVNVVAFGSSGSPSVCPAAQWNAGSSTCAAGQVVTDDTRVVVTLSAGNMRGVVRTPVSQGNQTVRDAGVSLEKWVPAPWAPGGGLYTWQWTDQFTNTSSSGAFSLNTDDTGAYRITGYPAWDDNAGLAKSSKIINLRSDGRWCQVDDSTGTSAGTFDCVSSVYSTDDSRITINLNAGNVSTIVRNPSGTPVRDAWVGLRQKVTSVFGSSWLWLGGSSTKSGGAFATFIDDSGTYALEVYPPWQGTDGSWPRFTVEFTVSCHTTPCTDTLDDSVYFPTPNMTGKVVSPDDSSVPIANSWVSVEQETTPGQYQWVDLGTSTNRSGEFVLNLPADDTYRLTANPSWGNPLGTRASVTVTVSSGGVATCVSGCLSGNRIQLLTANLTGKVRASSTAMQYSWVEVRDASSGMWITGGGTNGLGNFALTVPPGTYDVWAYPNWNLSQKPPKKLTVTVPGTTMPLDIDLDAVTPNLELTITGFTDSRLVAVDDSVGGVWVSKPAFTASSSGGTTNKALFALPTPGTYRLTVAPGIGKSVTSGSAQVIVTLTGSDLSTETVTFGES